MEFLYLSRENLRRSCFSKHRVSKAIPPQKKSVDPCLEKLTTLPAAFKFFSRALSFWLPRAILTVCVGCV
jgi:hypothetical protein